MWWIVLTSLLASEPESISQVDASPKGILVAVGDVATVGGEAGRSD
jgi:hypothetical protein